MSGGDFSSRKTPILIFCIVKIYKNLMPLAELELHNPLCRPIFCTFTNIRLMPFFKRFFVLFLGLLVWGKAFPQKRHNDAVTRVYSPAELKADALVLKNVIMKMHPVVGIYMPRAFYNALFDEYIKSLNDSLTEKQFRIRTKMVL